MVCCPSDCNSAPGTADTDWPALPELSADFARRDLIRVHVDVQLAILQPIDQRAERLARQRSLQVRRRNRTRSYNFV